MVNVGRIPGQEIIKPASYDALVAAWPTAGITRVALGPNQGSSGPGGRTVYRLSAGNPNAPTVYVDGGIHGAHEWHAPVSIPRFLAHLANPTGSAAPTLARLARELHWVTIPCVNPHAYAQAWTLNARNVDLNRNFDVRWAEYDDSTGIGSKGSAPFSELETQYVRDTVLAFKPVVALSWHTWGGFSGANAAGLSQRHAEFWRGVHATAKLSADVAYATEFVPPGGGNPTAANWLSQQTGGLGLPMIGGAPEPGSLLPTAEIDRYMQNYLLAVGVYALNYARTRQQQFRRRQPRGAPTLFTV